MPSQIGYFDSLKSVAGKVFNYLASITLTGVDGKTLTVSEDITLNCGVYLPVISDEVNVASSALYNAQWMRVGTMVIVAGYMEIDPTAAATTSFRLTLPVASALTSGIQLGGSGAIIGGTGVLIAGNAASDKASFSYISPGTASHEITYIYGYLVL